MKTAVVTGGSSGIGKSVARLLSENGYEVFELSRRAAEDGDIKHITADVTKPEEIKAAMKTAAGEKGVIDLLVCNAGMGISGAIEFTELSQAKKQMDVNFFGEFCCIKEALPYLRKSGDARIINLSSVAAPLSIPYQAFYSASKAAVNSLTLALANELRSSGIKVSAIMPGDVATGFTDAREKSLEGETFYGERIEKAVGAMEKDERGGMTPDFVANEILKIAKKKNPKVLYTAGGKYKFFVFLSKILPYDLCNRLVGKLY